MGVVKFTQIPDLLLDHSLARTAVVFRQSGSEGGAKIAFVALAL